MPSSRQSVLVLGFCEHGPYRHARQTLENLGVKWIPWHYHTRYVGEDVARDLRGGLSFVGRNVVFASWRWGAKRRATTIRVGRIDYFSFSGDALHMTVLLGHPVSSTVHVPHRPVLCFYVADAGGLAAVQLGGDE